MHRGLTEDGHSDLPTGVCVGVYVFTDTNITPEGRYLKGL